MYRVVFDTVVFVRSLINPYGVWGKLVFAHAQDYNLILSQPVIIEILEALHRPELTAKFRRLEDLDTRRVIDLLAQAELVELTTMPAFCRDPKDDKFLATVEVSKADHLVSEDRDLLDLKEYRGTKIIDGRSFLSMLDSATRT